MKIGTHERNIKITQTFFEKHINEDIIDANVDIHLNIIRDETMLVFKFDIHGSLISQCDICLDNVTIAVSAKEDLILKIVEKPQESDDENVVFITDKDKMYNIEQFVYESLILMLPMRKVHSGQGNDKCDPTMLDLIEKAAHQKNESQIDERWSALKNIKFED